VKLRDERREEKRALHIVEVEIRACRVGSHLVLIEEVEDEDDPWGTPESQKQGGSLDEAFIRETHSDPLDLPSLAEIEDDEKEGDLWDARIEADDQIFVATLYPDNPLEFIHATSTVSQCLARMRMRNPSTMLYQRCFTSLAKSLRRNPLTHYRRGGNGIM
jgi:hypothetical protein